LLALANPNKAAFLAGFFKTRKGQYAEGDRFLGIMVPARQDPAHVTTPARADTKAATDLLPDKIDAADRICERQLDRLMERYKDSNTDSTARIKSPASSWMPAEVRERRPRRRLRPRHRENKIKFRKSGCCAYCAITR
jgi:hypothetical protein